MNEEIFTVTLGTQVSEKVEDTMVIAIILYHSRIQFTKDLKYFLNANLAFPTFTN